MPERIKLKELPEENAPDYFRVLVRNCVETYKELPNDSICLDYNRVSGTLRAMVLGDEEYKRETRNIYAERCLEELRELNDIARPSADEEDDWDDDYADPRGKGKKKKACGADKDTLTTRFKAAQMRREIIGSLNESYGASERDAANLMFVGMSREEVEKNARAEIYEGDADEALGELANGKEEAPEGTSGKIRPSGRTKPPDDEDFFDVFESGEIVER
jgi:hypothetical protein